MKEIKDFEVRDDTIVFAQNEDDTFIITNEQGLTFSNVNILTDKGALINTTQRTISPELRIGTLTKFVFPWYKPTVKVDLEDVKTYTKLK